MLNEKLQIIVDALEDKKAERVVVIDISEVSSMADYFVITNGTNTSQIQALADNVIEQMAKNKMHARQTEGYNSANWILEDFEDVIVHIFDKESRGYYDLERIWRDGKQIEI